MDIMARKNKMPALVLLFLSYLTLCLSVPTGPVVFRSASHDKHTSLGKGVFVKRGIDPEYKRPLDELRMSPRVMQNDEKFMTFGSEPATPGSGGFIRCIGLVIASSQGVIIGHYSSTDLGISRANTNFPGLYMTTRMP